MAAAVGGHCEGSILPAPHLSSWGRPPSLYGGASRSDLKMKKTPCLALAPLPVPAFKLAWHVSFGDTAQGSFGPLP